MKILAIHNYYYQQRGGEDQCFEDEVEVLRNHGHQVISHTLHNDVIKTSSKWNVAVGTLWNRKEYKSVESIIREVRPDVVHAMNTFPLFSPSVLYAAKKNNVPVVQEVQNYRMSCAGAYLLRDGKVCEKCLGAAFPIHAVIHRCYRDSLGGSFVSASGIALHRLMRTWTRVVDLFLCPSEITRSKLIQAGLPADRISVKPNVLNWDPGIHEGDPARTDKPFAVFVGRLSPEKGIDTLLRAWQENRNLPNLKVIGDGPLASTIQAAQQQDDRIEWQGRLPIRELLDVVGQAACLVMPSLWYETFGRTTVEAFAKGTPVVGSRIGGTAEIIEEGETGWLFEPGNSNELATKVMIAISQSPEQALTMQRRTRKVFLDRYTASTNYRMLMDAYERAIDSHARDRKPVNK